jgi:putative hydrolase of the HAD superfamily
VPQAILFDMDDTLIVWDKPPETVWAYAANLYLSEYNGLDAAGLCKAIHATRDWYWKDQERHRSGRLELYIARREVVRLALKSLDIDNPALAGNIADAFSAEREKDEVLVPGAIETLETLRAKGLKLALITNGGSPLQRRKINKFQLAPHFDNILIEGEFGCGKPDERVFKHTLANLSVTPAQAWMVGDDSARDIAPCNALGIFSVWVNGFTDKPPDAKARPDRTIKSIAEIPALL